MTHIQPLSPKPRREDARQTEPSPRLGWAEWGSLGGTERLLPFGRSPLRSAAPVCVRGLLVAFALVCIVAMVR
ncbi:hypothetical protein [Roseixanthobacter pseudopolyaromaticivorans]|uniref:hypothetical protein n=1 Tax=Xanthobacteraceae TaxID=335928 RepID=UPI00372C597D